MRKIRARAGGPGSPPGGPKRSDGGWKDDGSLQAPPKRVLPYLYTVLAVCLSYALFGVIWDAGAETLHVFMLAGVVLCGIFALLYRRSPDRVMLAVLVAGIVMRIGYMLYTPYNLRGHDIASLEDCGHLSYIYNLFTHGSLPQSNRYEYYQPPLQHIAEAAVARAFYYLQPGAEIGEILDATKIVPCFASCAVLLVSRRICEAVRLPKRATALALVAVAFHPAFFILSASINNDSLMLLFFMASILYTVRWYYRPTMANILLIALTIGLAMMAKLSGAAAAFFTAPVFLIALVRMARERKAKSLVGQFAAFIGVCTPLALWYPVRNLLLFGQPLGYVFEPDLNTPMFCGGRSMIDRFLSFPPDQILTPLYCRPAGDCNLWLYTLKCSIFGEYAFNQPAVLASALILANLLMILLSLAAMIYVMARCKEANGFARYGLFGIWLVQIASFIVFNIKYPFGCTMDFRYILPTAIIGAIYIGIALDRIGRKGTLPSRLLYGFGCAAVGLFAVASVLFYAA